MTGPAHFNGRRRLMRARTMPETTARSFPTTTTRISVIAHPTTEMIWSNVR